MELGRDWTRNPWIYNQTHHRRHCVVSLSKNINPSLVLVQPRKTRPFITVRLLMGRKESNQTNKQTNKQKQSDSLTSNNCSTRSVSKSYVMAHIIPKDIGMYIYMRIKLVNDLEN